MYMDNSTNTCILRHEAECFSFGQNHTYFYWLHDLFNAQYGPKGHSVVLDLMLQKNFYWNLQTFGKSDTQRAAVPLRNLLCLCWHFSVEIKIGTRLIPCIKEEKN